LRPRNQSRDDLHANLAITPHLQDFDPVVRSRNKYFMRETL
jgi:hypothetical protein